MARVYLCRSLDLLVCAQLRFIAERLTIETDAMDGRKLTVLPVHRCVPCTPAPPPHRHRHRHRAGHHRDAACYIRETETKEHPAEHSGTRIARHGTAACSLSHAAPHAARAGRPRIRGLLCVCDAAVCSRATAPDWLNTAARKAEMRRALSASAPPRVSAFAPLLGTHSHAGLPPVHSARARQPVLACRPLPCSYALYPAHFHPLRPPRFRV
ncbi:hypothetical protein B0H17DRAFT_512263 [Mycena rosella]|uniref:Uncharacterized protein n=1 Tax=Mycena rosella TaxID=1033263 RepID=A0AAD7DJI4_MYCRO|nr:hypothetical protein B0H17DRAFT_512263 [Mycena rosella]